MNQRLQPSQNKLDQTDMHLQALLSEVGSADLSDAKKKNLIKQLTGYADQWQQKKGALPLGLSAAIAALMVGGSTNPLQAQQNSLFNGCLIDVTDETTEFDAVPAIPPANDQSLFWFGFDFADITGDGNPDLFIGTQDGGSQNGDSLYYFQNTGTCGENTNDFQLVRNVPADPFQGITGEYLSPEFVNLDGDSDLDLVLLDSDGGSSLVRYFLNTGTPTNPIFVEQFGMDNPFDGISGIGSNLFHTQFADLDNDSDLDLILAQDMSLRYFENSGNAAMPDFEEQLGMDNPFNGVVIGDGYAAPGLADFCVDDPDGDGDLDLFVGNKEGAIQYFVNEGDEENPVFVEQTGTDNPFDGIDLGVAVVPIFTDLDCDGDMDLFVGEKYGNFTIYRNVCGNFLEESPSIPTMSQWGYFLYALSMFNLFMVVLYNIAKRKTGLAK